MFSVFVCGCETVDTGYVAPDKVPSENDRDFQDGVVKIVGLFKKDGSYINLIDKDAKIDITGKTKSISYDDENSKRKVIAINDISTVKVNIVKGSVFSPLIVIGGVALILVITFFIILATGHFRMD